MEEFTDGGNITDEIQTAVKATYGRKPTAAAIWKSIRHPDISRQVRNFLWKTLHGANRLGKHWRHVPDMEERETCGHCGVEETMEHILFSCESPGQAEVWSLAKKMRLLAHNDWPEPSFGLVLGCALAVFKTDDGKPDLSSARLYRMIISESIWAIWKMRCDRVIKFGGEAFSQAELSIDRALTNRVKFGKQYSVDPQRVLDTWKGSLYEEEKLPERWLGAPEVLVGVAPMRSNRPPSPPDSRETWPD
ncbi:hypothetical protein C8R43DRAFT_1095917 [Mycena crocata]|nr:hypothetical protein C8R43DRAFT_1095917 [Mycena crocata]